jgi:hypothetical protein
MMLSLSDTKAQFVSNFRFLKRFYFFSGLGAVWEQLFGIVTMSGGFYA